MSPPTGDSDRTGAHPESGEEGGLDRERNVGDGARCRPARPGPGPHPPNAVAPCSCSSLVAGRAFSVRISVSPSLLVHTRPIGRRRSLTDPSRDQEQRGRGRQRSSVEGGPLARRHPPRRVDAGRRGRAGATGVGCHGHLRHDPGPDGQPPRGERRHRRQLHSLLAHEHPDRKPLEPRIQSGRSAHGARTQQQQQQQLRHDAQHHHAERGRLPAGHRDGGRRRCAVPGRADGPLQQPCLRERPVLHRHDERPADCLLDDDRLSVDPRRDAERRSEPERRDRLLQPDLRRHPDAGRSHVPPRRRRVHPDRDGNDLSGGAGWYAAEPLLDGRGHPDPRLPLRHDRAGPHPDHRQAGQRDVAAGADVRLHVLLDARRVALVQRVVQPRGGRDLPARPDERQHGHRHRDRPERRPLDAHGPDVHRDRRQRPTPAGPARHAQPGRPPGGPDQRAAAAPT